MLQFLLILMGLISNPSSTNHTSNGVNDGTTTTAAATQPDPGDTGGENGQTPKK